jgi:hypothetical protein
MVYFYFSGLLLVGLNSNEFKTLIINYLAKNKELFLVYVCSRSIPLLKWWLASYGTLKKGI